MSPLRKKLIVVGDRLLVRPEVGEEKTNTGLYLPASAQSSGMTFQLSSRVTVMGPVCFSNHLSI